MKAMSIVLVMVILATGTGNSITTVHAIWHQQVNKDSRGSALCMRENYDRRLNHTHVQVPNQPITVEVELPKYSFVVGEPIDVRLILMNQTPEPISMEVYEGAFRLYLSEDGKNFYHYQGEELLRGIQISKTLKPGEPWEVERTILDCPWSEDRLVIREAGRYYLLADLGVGLDERQIYDSQAISFQVEGPVGENAKAFSLLRGEDGTYRDYVYFIQGHRDSSYFGSLYQENPRYAEKFSGVIQQYPSSIYALGLRASMQKLLKGISIDRLSPEVQPLYERLQAQYLDELPRKKP